MSASLNWWTRPMATLQHDIAALKRDVTNLMEHLKAGATGTAQSAAAQIDAGARQVYSSIAAEADRSAKALSKQVEEQPLMSAKYRDDDPGRCRLYQPGRLTK